MHQPVVSHGRAYDNVRTMSQTTRWILNSNKLTSRIPNNMHNRHKLGISSRMATVRAKFPWPKSRDEGSGTPTAFDSAVAIGGVGGDELVWVAAEVNTGLAD